MIKFRIEFRVQKFYCIYTFEEFLYIIQEFVEEKMQIILSATGVFDCFTFKCGNRI